MTSAEPGLGRIGKFRLVRELGRGGMGIVYLAEDTHLGRVVALKVLPHSVATEERIVERFVREAQAAARLRHPNIIPIYDAGEADGTYYFSMAYVPGLSLARLLRALREGKAWRRGVLTVVRRVQGCVAELDLEFERPTDPTGGAEVVLRFDRRNYVREALRLFAEVAEALHYAHEQGVVHRDVKPSNLLLSAENRLLVADFGLAKIGDARTITRSGDLLGSPSYMSPEQASGRRAPIDGRTDVWSLGVTLYELLTLRHPFEAPSLEVSLRNILHREPPLPRRINPRLPKDVETILLKALEKSPDRRYRTAAEFADDMRRILNYEAVHARSAGVVTRSMRFVRRHSLRVALAALALLVAVLAGTIVWMAERLDRSDLDQAFATFNGFRQSLGDRAPAPPLVDEVRAELERERSEADDLQAAIDACLFRTISEAQQALWESHDPDAAWRALEKLHILVLHNPSAGDRTRMEQADRASVDMRTALVWSLLERLRRADPADPSLGRRFDRLLVLAGLDGYAWFREKNPLVRVCAVEALGRLALEAPLRGRCVAALLRLAEPSEESAVVRSEALATLAALPFATAEPDIADAVARAVLADPSPPELAAVARLFAARLLGRAPLTPERRRALARLASDPVVSVQRTARSALPENG